MKKISGGVCAAKGFTAAGIHAGVKAGSSPEKNDLALILSDCECAAAATFTNNRVKAAPVYTTMNHLENGILQRQRLRPQRPRTRGSHVRRRGRRHRPSG